MDPKEMQRLLRQALQDALLGDALSACEALRVMLDKREWDLVRRARTDGASWADIARQVGVTRQAIQGRVRRWEKDYGDDPRVMEPNDAPRS